MKVFFLIRLSSIINIFKNIRTTLIFILIGLLSALPASELMRDSKIQGRVNIVNGASAECVMHRFYTRSGWVQIEGEVGRNGIDGLYYKKKHGEVREVLVAESKWNKAKLGRSGKDKLVRQMSQEWILKTLSRLQRYQPLPEYPRIRAVLKQGQYRARLFKLVPLNGNRLQIKIYKVRNKGLKHFDILVENHLPPITIDKPKNRFEADILESYNRCRRTYLKRYFPMLDEKDIRVLLKDNYLQKKDIKAVLL
jgi:hypothetical protein